MLGKLSWEAVPFDQPIPLFAAAIVGVVIIGVLAWVTLKGWLPYLWREWITSVDHKRIGIMYMLLAMVMLLRGFADAIMMRSQQALAFQSEGYLPPEHYNQIFSAHGTLMIFFVAMPFVIGLMNFVMPLQLGIRDVAFPTLNSVSFWLTATGALLVNISLVVGEFARTGWLPYPPLSELDLLARGRRRLLSVVAADLRRGNLADRRQLRDDDPEDPRARHDLYAHADVLLDHACLQPADRRGFSDPHGDAGDAAARSLPRLSFLHQRSRRQRHDVHEPDLGVGTSGGLHPDPAGLRHLFRSDLDLLRASRCSATARW